MNASGRSFRVWAKNQLRFEISEKILKFTSINLNEKLIFFLFLSLPDPFQHVALRRRVLVGLGVSSRVGWLSKPPTQLQTIRSSKFHVAMIFHYLIRFFLPRFPHPYFAIRLPLPYIPQCDFEQPLNHTYFNLSNFQESQRFP